MAVILDATVGSTSMNSYLTRAESNTILEENPRIYTEWQSVTDNSRDAWLVFSTRFLDWSYTYNGQAVSDTQLLEWPREYCYDRRGEEVDSTTVPEDIKRAVAYQAHWFSQNDPFSAVDSTGIRSMKADVIEIEFDKWDKVISKPSIVKRIMSWWGTPANGNIYSASYRMIEKA